MTKLLVVKCTCVTMTLDRAQNIDTPLDSIVNRLGESMQLLTERGNTL